MFKSQQVKVNILDKEQKLSCFKTNGQEFIQ